jgi:hypothetical protein
MRAGRRVDSHPARHTDRVLRLALDTNGVVHAAQARPL